MSPSSAAAPAQRPEMVPPGQRPERITAGTAAFLADMALDDNVDPEEDRLAFEHQQIRRRNRVLEKMRAVFNAAKPALAVIRALKSAVAESAPWYSLARMSRRSAADEDEPAAEKPPPKPKPLHKPLVPNRKRMLPAPGRLPDPLSDHMGAS